MPVVFHEPKPKLLYLKSFTGDKVYTIDSEKKTCNCYNFSKEGKCKHLAQLNLYNPKFFKATTTPTFSQALSGLVKCIRLRNVDEALYWLVYLYGFQTDAKNTQQGYRTRLAKRILICSAEDGHSISVMEKNAENYPTNTKIKTDLVYLAADILRICAVPNWWHPSTNGAEYIHAGMVGDRLALYNEIDRSEQPLFDTLNCAIDGKDANLALGCIMAANQISHTRQAEWVAKKAHDMGHQEALRLANVHLSQKSALSADNNFIGQAVWWLCGNVSPVYEESPTIIAGTVYEALKKAHDAWKTPHIIPDWCCDGTHSSGNDPRFMGAWQQMNSACNAAAFYGRLNPTDQWLPEFNDWTGLVFSKGPEGAS